MAVTGYTKNLLRGGANPVFKSYEHQDGVRVEGGYLETLVIGTKVAPAG
jgi:hypothetical protein